MCIAAIPSAVHAQPAAPNEPGAQLPVSLDRIREGLQREPVLTLDFLDPTIPLFRTSVTEKGLKLEDYWKIGPDTAVSRDVRPSFASMWHHEFLSMTTPKQQIAASAFGIFGNPIHPVGPPVLPIAKAIKGLLSNAERGRIKRQIQEELKQIEANQAQQTQATSGTPETSETAKPKTPPPGVPDDPQ